jgi:membrane fusion protein (multidrug efflux system)
MNRKWIGLVVIFAAAVALVVAGYFHLRHGRIYPSTDDAYVGGTVVPVASRVPGTLVEVPVAENDHVEAGQVIAQLDPRDFDEAVARAQAQLARAQAQLAQDEAQIARAEAEIEVARSQADLARLDRDRYASLQKKGSTPERQAEQARTAAAVAEAQLAAAEKALVAVRAKLSADEKDVARYQAELSNAQLQRSYCTITAPCAGMIADKSAQAGQVVVPAQPLCRVVPLSGTDIWIDANFKESQLHRIRAGQPVTIEVDAIENHEFRGTVSALSAGTGAAFALLPPENASGNWVKIVQRLPVRVMLADGDEQLKRLRLGLSTRVTVDTRAGDQP